MKKIITTPNAPAPIGPYNQAVLSNGVLYMSGQIPFDPITMELVDGDLVKESHGKFKSCFRSCSDDF